MEGERTELRAGCVGRAPGGVLDGRASASSSAPHRTTLVLDPRTKLAVLATANALVFLSTSFVLEVVLMVASLGLMASGGRGRTAAKLVCLFVALVAVEALIVPRLDGFAAGLVMFIAVLMRKIMPCLVLGLWILATTEVGAFLEAMRRMRVPENVVVPLSVAFRYFPTLRDEWGSIRDAMRMRGIGLSFSHVMVPVMLSAATVSDELSAAALTRGIDRPGPHTSMARVGIGRADRAVMAVCLVGIATAFGLKAAGIL